MNEHGAVREALEIAAVEPGGLDRLEAGDAPDAALVVGHLAGCPECLEELARLRRAETLLRPIVAGMPDPALRERTLAFVREVGAVRAPAAPPTAAADRPAGLPAPTPMPHAPTGAPATQAPTGAPAPLAGHRPRSARIAGWAGSLAAVLVIGLLGGALFVDRGAPDGNADPAVALAAVTREASELLAAGDAREVVLRDAAGAPAGSLVLSPSKGRLVVSAADLAAPPAGSEHRCWVEVGGMRIALGTMWRAGDVAWWSGPVDLPAEIPPGLTYGVSLVAAGAAGPGSVVLSGKLEDGSSTAP
jgi:hypothetical protein